MGTVIVVVVVGIVLLLAIYAAGPGIRQVLSGGWREPKLRPDGERRIVAPSATALTISRLLRWRSRQNP